MKPPPDISREIIFKTARSGGKGGQNVNKVETMVEGSFEVQSSSLLEAEQKQMIMTRLKNRISAAGMLQVRSQVYRSQYSNKMDVIEKMNGLVAMALKKERPRVPTRPTAASKARRIESKKRMSEIKRSRGNIRDIF